MNLYEIDLPKLAGVAGSAVGMVIATAILLSWLTARYIPTFDRYRTLTSEFRDGTKNGTRRDEVHDQITLYQRRLIHMSRASCTLCFALFCSLVAIAAATVSILLPGRPGVVVLGLLGLFGTFGLFAVAVGMVVVENRLDRRAIGYDVRDLDEVPGR